MFYPAGEIGAIAYTNKAAIYRLLFDVAAERFLQPSLPMRNTLAHRSAPRLVNSLHTWGSAMTIIRMCMASFRRGLSPDGAALGCLSGTVFLPVRVLSRLFPATLHRGLATLHRTGVQFFSEIAGLADAGAFGRWRLCNEWVVYAKRPLPALRQCWRIFPVTHRVAISEPPPAGAGQE